MRKQKNLWMILTIAVLPFFLISACSPTITEDEQQRLKIAVLPILDALPMDKVLVVEVKCGSEVIPAMQKAISESGKLAQCSFISFGWETICDIQKAFPDNDCYYLKMTPIGLSNKIEQSAEVGLKGVNLYHKIINQKVVSKAQGLGIEVLAWTVDDPEVFKKLKRLGVKAITTNKPEDFVK